MGMSTHGLRMDVRKISPAKAAQILEGHDNYRNLSQRRMAAYSRLMQQGKWRRSVILFGTDGELLDGQTRLAAVIRSGQPQEFVCIHNWAKEDVIAVDDLQVRTKAQAVKAERGVVAGNVKMALATGIEHIMNGTVTLTNLQAIELYDKHKDVVERIAQSLGGQLRAAVHGMAFARAIVNLPERSDEIVAALEKAVVLDFAEPRMNGLRLYCRWLMVTGHSIGGGMARRAVYLRCARALVAYLNDENIDKLYAPKDDPFPVKATDDS